MRTHTSGFKNDISKFGRQINARIYKYSRNYNLVDSNNLNIITEDEIQLISDNIETTSQSLIDSDDIYSIDIVKNGQLLQSLMKECDFESSVQLNVGDIINPELGVLVNNNFEYLNYGNYIVYSKEYVAENKTWRYVCYDKMLYSMVQYKPLNLTYPCTIREYLIALADRIGLNFANASDTFPNYNQDVLNELFEGQNVTYRDILDKLSQITASNILINDDDELELGYPSETSDTITEENLKDINVSFGEMFGPINKVSIIHDSVEYYAEDSQSVGQNGLTQINIVDNIFGFNGNSNAIAQSILNKIKGLAYSINDFTTTGVCYYDFLDLFNVSTQNSNYKCLLLNNEINITQGIKEQIFNQKPEHTEKESENYTTSVMNSKEVSFTLNAQKDEIQSKVAKDDVVSTINQSAEEIVITGNRFVVKATNYSLDRDGTMMSKAGIIGGWHITNNQLYCDIVPPYDYTNSDVSRIQAIINGTITPTQQDYDKYDFYRNGTIELIDMQICQKLVYYDLKHSNPGKLLLDTTDWFRPIKIINSSNEILASFGVNGVWTRPTS